MTLTFDLLTSKVLPESCVAWATSVPVFVFLCLSVLDLGPRYATDRRQRSDRRQTKASLNASALWGGGIKISYGTNTVASIGHGMGGNVPRPAD